MVRYSQMLKYRKCPRLYAFDQMGYEIPIMPEPVTTGSLVHSGLAYYYSGKSGMAGIVEAEQLYYNQLSVIKDGAEYQKAKEQVARSSQKAQEILARWLSGDARQYKLIAVELELQRDGVVTHPDLIAYMNGEMVIVDFKTGRSPDVRYLDMSGQVDLAAYMLDGKPSLVVYQVISEESGIWKHVRPPRLAQGEAIFWQIANLVSLDAKVCLRYPHPVFDCPNRCPFFLPCYTLETCGVEAAIDILDSQYRKVEQP